MRSLRSFEAGLHPGTDAARRRSFLNPENQKAQLPFMRRVKAECPGRSVGLHRLLVSRGSCAGRKMLHR